MTDYTNRPLRQACEELGMNYLDESGWALIRLDAPPIFIRTQGTDRSAPRAANEVTRLNGVAVGRIVRTLLEIHPPIGVRDLAARASVKSPGSVSKLLPTRWTEDYAFLNGNGVVLDYLAPRGLDPVLAQVSTLPDVCVTGAFAAKEYLLAGTVPVVPPTRLSLYASEPSDVASRLGLLRVDRQSSNVIMTVPRDPQLVTSPERRRGTLPLAPLPQVLADLVTLPGRESALADQLIDQLAKTDPTWRDQ